MSASKKAGATGITVAIYALFFMVPCIGYVSPGLNTIAQVCDVDMGTVSYLMTIPSITGIFAAFVAGAIAGKKARYKTILMIGVAGTALFGAMPGFLSAGTSFVLIMVLRALYGLFLGLLMPTINACVGFLFVDEDRRAKVMGRGNALFSIGALCGFIVGGLFTSMAWNGSFWLYLIGLVVLLMTAILFKEPERPIATDDKGAKARITAPAWFYIIAFCFMNLCLGLFNSLFSNTLAVSGMGSSSQAGLFQGFEALCGMLFCFGFAAIYRKCKDRTLFLACAVMCLSYFALYFGLESASMPLLIVALVMLGSGSMILAAGTPFMISLATSPAAYMVAMAAQKIFWEVGNFLSSPFIQAVSVFTGTADYRPFFLIGGIILFALTIAYFIASRVFGGNGLPSGEATA